MLPPAEAQHRKRREECLHLSNNTHRASANAEPDPIWPKSTVKSPVSSLREHSSEGHVSQDEKTSKWKIR